MLRPLPGKVMLLSIAPAAVDTPLKPCAWVCGGVATNDGKPMPGNGISLMLQKKDGINFSNYQTNRS